MSGYIDNAKYKNMIKNRPLLSSIPNIKPSIYSGFIGLNTFAVLTVASMLATFTYKQYISLHSARVFNTRKQFKFEADPYSNKVNCLYKDIPYTQSGF